MIAPRTKTQDSRLRLQLELEFNLNQAARWEIRAETEVVSVSAITYRRIAHRYFASALEYEALLEKQS